MDISLTILSNHKQVGAIHELRYLFMARGKEISFLEEGPCDFFQKVDGVSITEAVVGGVVFGIGFL